MYLPVELIKENLFIRRLAKYGFKGYIIRFIKEVEYSEEALNQLWIEFIKYRIIYDFEYWAYSFIFIFWKMFYQLGNYIVNIVIPQIFKRIYFLLLEKHSATDHVFE